MIQVLGARRDLSRTSTTLHRDRGDGAASPVTLSAFGPLALLSIFKDCAVIAIGG